MANTEQPTGEVSPQRRDPRRNRPGEVHRFVQCTWPACSKPRASGAYGDEVPLCVEHIYETWQLVEVPSSFSGSVDKPPPVRIVRG